MKEIFIRGIWGIYDNSHRITKRRSQIDKDIEKVIQSPYQVDFKTYVMGIDNYEKCLKKGINCQLICEEPYKFDLKKYQYRNKLEIIKWAIENDSLQEFVYLDWDCFLQKKLSNDFWKGLRNKREFQANLQLYHRRKCPWRKYDLRKVPNGGFIYLRNPDLIYDCIKHWEGNKQDNDEPAWAKIVEQLSGGSWKGIGHYWNNFEPMFVNLHKASSFDSKMLEKKNVNFIHFQG